MARAFFDPYEAPKGIIRPFKGLVRPFLVAIWANVPCRSKDMYEQTCLHAEKNWIGRWRNLQIDYFSRERNK